MNSLSPTAAAELLDSLGASGIPVSKEEPIPEPGVRSSTYKEGLTSPTEEKALKLLGSGVPAESVAAALGVTPARISQLLADERFADQVAALRYENLQQHNVRDSHYDTIEDKLLDKLEKSLPLMFKPETILKAIQTINGAKRRGQSSPDQVTNQQNIVNLVLPKAIAMKFSVNIDNQVTRAGQQELHTMPSGNLLKSIEEAEEARVIEHQKAVTPGGEQELCTENTEVEENL